MLKNAFAKKHLRGVVWSLRMCLITMFQALDHTLPIAVATLVAVFPTNPHTQIHWHASVRHPFTPPNGLGPLPPRRMGFTGSLVLKSGRFAHWKSWVAKPSPLTNCPSHSGWGTSDTVSTTPKQYPLSTSWCRSVFTSYLKMFASCCIFLYFYGITHKHVCPIYRYDL